MNLKELKNLKNIKRVVLLNSQDEVHLNNQRELFDRSPQSYQDRDIVIVSGLEDDIIEEFEMIHDFDLVLLGKDGGVKYRSHGVTNPEKIYSLVDQMPKRRTEMENRL